MIESKFSKHTLAALVLLAEDTFKVDTKYFKLKENRNTFSESMARLSFGFQSRSLKTITFFKHLPEVNCC